MLYGIGEFAEIVTLPKGKVNFSVIKICLRFLSYAGNMAVGVALTTEGEWPRYGTTACDARVHSPHAPR